MKASFQWMGVGLALFAWPFGTPTQAALQRDQVKVADEKKTKAYLDDGIIVGGDRAVRSVAVRDIRHSKNSEFERIVIDLEGPSTGDSPVAIQRPPFFQVGVSPEERQILVHIWGQPKLKFESSLKKMTSLVQKSALIKNFMLIPGGLDKEVWTFAIALKSAVSIEVFELREPVRIILDMRRKKWE